MPAAMVQPSKTKYDIAIIFHIEIVQAMDEVFHVLSKMKKPWLKMWQFEGKCIPLLMFGNLGPGFQKNNHQLSKISHLNFFFQGFPKKMGCSVVLLMLKVVAFHGMFI